MTLSFHKFGPGTTDRVPFFPGTGDLTDTGAHAGKGYAINCPLRDGMDDASYEAIFKPGDEPQYLYVLESGDLSLIEAVDTDWRGNDNTSQNSFLDSIEEAAAEQIKEDDKRRPELPLPIPRHSDDATSPIGSAMIERFEKSGKVRFSTILYLSLFLLACRKNSSMSRKVARLQITTSKV